MKTRLTTHIQRMTLTLAAYAASSGLTSASIILLDFEGVGDSASVNDFYNDGTDSAGNSGVNYGVNFTSNSLGLISGNYENNPSPPTILFFLSGTAATMNVTAGFKTGFSFYYSSNTDATVKVWDGLNSSGTLLASIDLVAQGNEGSGTQYYRNWSPIGVTFDGIAKSVDFGGTVNHIGFDNITIGSETAVGRSSNIDTEKPFYLSSGLGATVNPAFVGGTLRGDASATYAQDFTINGQGGTLDGFGNTVIFTGVFSDLTPGTPGGLTIANSGVGGSITLTGANTYSGETLVQGGTLLVNGSLTSAVTVSAGATMGGTGSITGPVKVGGILAPGNSPGSLTVSGPVTLLSSSNLQVEIDGLGTGSGAGSYDRLLATGPSGGFSADGTLTPMLRGITGGANNTFTPALGDRFRIVTAQNGLAGRFATVSQPATGQAAGTRLDVFYNGDNSNSIDLFTTPDSYASHVSLLNGNENARSVGQALDRMRDLDASNSTTPRQNALRYAVADLTSGQIPTVATALAGEVHGAIAAAAPEAGRALQSIVARQLGSSTGSQEQPDLEAGDNIWFDFHTAYDHSESDAWASGYSDNCYQYTLGGDLLHSRTNRFGMGITYASTYVSASRGSGMIDEVAPFLYAQYVVGTNREFIFDGLFAYGFSIWETERANPLGVGDKPMTDADGHSTTLGLGVRSPVTVGAVTLEPFVRLLWQNSNRNGDSETPDSPAALRLARYDLNGTRLLVGMAVGSVVSDPLAAPFTYRASVAFGHDFGNLVDPTVPASLAGLDYRIYSPKVARDFGQVQLSGTYRVAERAYVHLGLGGEVRENRLDSDIHAGLNYKF